MKQALEKYRQELAAIKEAGTWKGERVITTPQKSRIDTTEAQKVVNMCANNYLGLSNHPALIEAAKGSYDKWGFGLSSVRFICGTQSVHKELEKKLAEFLGMDDVILYSSCFDANGGLFETLLGPEDAVISDELNHASIIDGVRLCKAKRFRYKNNDMADLRAQLEAARDAGCKVKLIATDGVFSMDGYIANLQGICDLADEFDALVIGDTRYTPQEEMDLETRLERTVYHAVCYKYCGQKREIFVLHRSLQCDTRGRDQDRMMIRLRLLECSPSD